MQSEKRAPKESTAVCGARLLKTGWMGCFTQLVHCILAMGCILHRRFPLATPSSRKKIELEIEHTPRQGNCLVRFLYAPPTFTLSCDRSSSSNPRKR
eukprot:2306004-Amphidinium_carterae.1